MGFGMGNGITQFDVSCHHGVLVAGRLPNLVICPSVHMCILAWAGWLPVHLCCIFAWKLEPSGSICITTRKLN